MERKQRGKDFQDTDFLCQQRQNQKVKGAVSIPGTIANVKLCCLVFPKNCFLLFFFFVTGV
jgi:hypothetical protein